MKVLVLPEVRQYFSELSPLLYEKGYFGFLEAAEKYVGELFEDIKTTLPTRQKRHAPFYFERYGKDMYYSVFRKSRHTQWYVFFSIYENNGELIYLVRYISNNHIIAQFL
ncbi:MAG: hypothetical protein LBT94_03280 [Prevotellaceae bacterium]|jgi:hypothetical protein|nr:hypothetical protein [Prevotellaceae bacterium]